MIIFNLQNSISIWLKKLHLEKESFDCKIKIRVEQNCKLGKLGFLRSTFQLGTRVHFPIESKKLYKRRVRHQ